MADAFGGLYQGRGLLFLQMKHADRVTRNNEGHNFRASMLSSSKYLFYLQLGAPLLPASIQEYNDPQSQCVSSLGNMHLKGEITKLFIIATDKKDTALGPN